MQRPDPGQRGSVAANRNRCGPSRRRVGVGLSASRPPIRRCSMLLSQCPRQEHAWRSARADQEPCKPLREVRATFFPVLDDVTNDLREGCGDGHDPMANVTLNIVGPSWYDQSKIFYLDRPERLAASNTFMLLTGGPSSVPVRKCKRRHYGRHQAIRSWHGCRPGHDAIL